MHLKTGNFFFKKIEENKGFSFHAYFCLNLWMIPIDADTYFCSKERKKNNVVFVDTILLLSVEYVGFFQGKIVERESHEMTSLTEQSKAWGLNNSEHFVRMDKICSRGWKVLSTTPVFPPILVGLESQPPSVCSQVSPQVFRLGGECFGRWWLEVYTLHILLCWQEWSKMVDKASLNILLNTVV